MAEIENPRWEAYARARVEGFNMTTSARKAGYDSRCVKNTAGGLERRPVIVARMQELRDLIAAKPSAEEIAAAAAEQAKVVAQEKAKRKRPTREQIVADLQDVADEAKEHKQFSARLKALELIGREIGMFVERTMQITSPLDGLTADQLLLLLRAVDQIDAPRPVIDVVALPVQQPVHQQDDAAPSQDQQGDLPKE